MTTSNEPAVVTCTVLPADTNVDTIYTLTPTEDNVTYYANRTDRNIGWITREEQGSLKNAVVGIAGCGGMGGTIAAILLRLGVGEIRIADCEVFDESNINRQFGASRGHVGMSKALTTAKMLRNITDDTKIVVYPQGVAPETVSHFLDGCDVVCDEIEFWAAGSRILLHQEARERGISLFNCNTIGFGTRLFLFKPSGCTVEQCLNLSYEQAFHLQQRIQSNTAQKSEIRQLMNSVLQGLVPDLPEYCPSSTNSTVEMVHARLFNENCAPIIATNPSLASGFVSNHVLFFLLRKSSVRRSIVQPPGAPGYLYIDTAFMDARVVERREVR